MARFLRIVAVPMAAGLLLGSGLTSPATAATAPVPSSAKAAALALRSLGLRIVREPESSLPPALRRQRGAIFFRIVNYYGLCLDANNSGPTAGQNGDKVQLWTCLPNANQGWTFGNSDHAGNYEIINQQYSSKCLNANDTGGLADGRAVQLWGCVATSNAEWDYAGWADCVALLAAPCRLRLEAGNYRWVLDANASGVHNNGDKVQIWTPGGNNQLWQ